MVIVERGSDTAQWSYSNNLVNKTEEAQKYIETALKKSETEERLRLLSEAKQSLNQINIPGECVEEIDRISEVVSQPINMANRQVNQWLKDLNQTINTIKLNALKLIHKNPSLKEVQEELEDLQVFFNPTDRKVNSQNLQTIFNKLNSKEDADLKLFLKYIFSYLAHGDEHIALSLVHECLKGKYDIDLGDLKVMNEKHNLNQSPFSLEDSLKSLKLATKLIIQHPEKKTALNNIAAMLSNIKRILQQK